MHHRALPLLPLIAGLVMSLFSPLPAHAENSGEPPATVVVAEGASDQTRLALSPGWLYGMERSAAWVRQGSDRFSTPTALPSFAFRKSLSASAGRAVVAGTFIDRGTPGREDDHLHGAADMISGPRALGVDWNEIIHVDGQRFGWLRPLRNFGPVTLLSGGLWLDGRSIYTPLAGRWLRDVWGHWVRSWDGTSTHITNWVTGMDATVDPAIHGKDGLLGDGVYVTSLDGQIFVFDLSRAGALVPVLTFEGTPKAIERNRLAWVDPEGRIKVSTLPVGGTTAAFFLGAAGDARKRSVSKPWVFGLDFSAPLSAGRLDVRDGAGALVRSLPTAASGDGSLRLAWDLRNSAGQPVRNGTYTWQFTGKDATGQSVSGLVPGSTISGSVDVALNQFVTTTAPDWFAPCGRSTPVMKLPEMEGVSYSYSTQDGVATVTATAERGWVMSGDTTWTLQLRRQSCDGIVAPPTFIDEPGTHHDRFVLPRAVDPVGDYWVDGTRLLAGTYRTATGTVVVQAHFQDDVAPLEWRHTFSTTGPIDVYTTPGEHFQNGRWWRTICEPYSVTIRCRTDIIATKVEQRGKVFVRSNDWVFNNLTYLPAPRAMWKGNPLGSTKEWTTKEGRRWRTECDTPATGRGGCRSFVEARVIDASPRPGGGYSYSWTTKWVFNNMVRFS